MVTVARRHHVGFTLIELLIAVAIASILATIAFGAYGSYILSSKRTESFSMLNDYRLKMEQLKQNTRSYADPLNANICGVPATAGKYFDFTCVPAAFGKQFTATASNKGGVGMGNAADYRYSIDQDGVKNTPTFAGAAGPNGIWKNK